MTRTHVYAASGVVGIVVRWKSNQPTQLTIEKIVATNRLKSCLEEWSRPASTRILTFVASAITMVVIAVGLACRGIYVVTNAAVIVCFAVLETVFILLIANTINIVVFTV